MINQNQKKRIYSKILKPKHKKAFKFIWTFNRFFIKFKSYNFFLKLNKTIFTKKNVFLMFYYFYNFKVNLKAYRKSNIKLLNKNFISMLHSLDLRLDIILFKMTFLTNIVKAQHLIKKGFIFVNGHKYLTIKTCAVFDTIWINTLVNYNCFLFKKWVFNEKIQNNRKKTYWTILTLKKYQLKYNSYLEIDFKIKQLIILKHPKINILLTNTTIPLNSLKMYANIALKHQINRIYLSY